MKSPHTHTHIVEAMSEACPNRIAGLAKTEANGDMHSSTEDQPILYMYVYMEVYRAVGCQ